MAISWTPLLAPNDTRVGELVMDMIWVMERLVSEIVWAKDEEEAKKRKRVDDNGNNRKKVRTTK